MSLDQLTPAVAPRHEPGAVWRLPERIGVTNEMGRLREFLDGWIAAADGDVREMLRYQLSARAKYFRPVTIFACQRAMTGRPADDEVIRVAAAVELFHNYTLVFDDIVDRDRYRRGKLALHCRFGSVPGLMVGAYLAFGACHLIADDEKACRVFSDMGKRIGAVECRQWRLRRHPGDIELWRSIASEDTGALFEACARVATPDGELARFGRTLGTLYHGCDDVADIRGTVALGTASEKDVTDRILTLTAAIATADPRTADLFAEGGLEVNEELGDLLAEAIPEAERVLDSLACEAEQEAIRVAPEPEGLVELVRYTRALSDA